MKKKITFILTLILMFTLVAQSSFAYAFSSNSPYTGQTYQHNDRFSDRIVVNGIDVSQWQGTINWDKVKADGIDFAIIRAGGRFFVSGGLYFDDNFYQNIKAAQDAGIMVGVYYFSQAVTTAEAREEANWVLDYIEGYDLQLPIYMDYEMSSDPSGRINNLSKATRTANAKAFCSVIEAAGYETGVYSNLNFLNNSIDGAQLSGLYNMWAAQYNYRCQYASDYIMWQYSSDGSVDGISGRTDMNFMYLEEKPAATQARSIANCQITVAEAVYDGEANYEPEVTVTYNGAELTEGVDYELGYINNREVGTAYVYVKGTGQYADYQTVAFEILRGKIPIETLEVQLEYDTTLFNGKEKTPKVTIAGLEQGKDFSVTYSNNIYAGTASVTIVGTRAYGGTVVKTFKIERQTGSGPLFDGAMKIRVNGNNRYDTSIQSAEALKITLCTESFDNIIVASGESFADALSGSYLAMMKSAPILLVNQYNEQLVKEYIAQNLNADGCVYILGGEGAISKKFEENLGTINIKRLGGKTRFDTNLEILKEAGSDGEELLICQGLDFADALAASSSKKPILLVDDELNENQIGYLKQLSTSRFYLIGGPSVVSNNVGNELEKMGKDVKRIYGDNRYETSVEVAKEFFPQKVETVVLVCSVDFPDGLSGGPLATSLDAPILLVNDTNTNNAEKYVELVSAEKAAVIGGSLIISDNTVNRIMN